MKKREGGKSGWKKLLLETGGITKQGRIHDEKVVAGGLAGKAMWMGRRSMGKGRGCDVAGHRHPYFSRIHVIKNFVLQTLLPTTLLFSYLQSPLASD